MRVTFFVGIPVYVLAVVGYALVVTARYALLRERYRVVGIDPTTGLDNFAHFLLRAQAMIKKGGSWSLVLVDVDGLGAINRRFDHGVGDAVLEGVAQRLTEGLDETRPLITRYGGDEFLILWPRRVDEEWMSEHIGALMAEEVTTPSGRVGVSVSVGCSEVDPSRPLRRQIGAASRQLKSGRMARRVGRYALPVALPA